MPTVTGVKFRSPGKVYYFAPGELTLHYNDHVIVETIRGIEYGTVVLPTREVEEENLAAPLREVIRIATEEDEAHEAENREKERAAYTVCLEKIRAHNLEMKLVSAEYTFDNSKLLFYFTADGRVDFRELVKDLAGVFRTRIELRQIGVRDETRILGGMGCCGRQLCCASFLHEFEPVSIRMAKEQNLSLNPTKISGTCGRLMCCLKNEQEAYEYLSRGLPRKGDTAVTPDGLNAEVQSVNILRQLVRVVVQLENEEKELREYPVSEIRFTPKKGRKKPEAIPEIPEEEVKEVEEELQILEEIEEEEEAEEASAPDEITGEKPNKKRRRRHKPRRKNKGDGDRPGKHEGDNKAGEGKRR